MTSMKYLEYSYVVNKPVEPVFNYLINLEQVHGDLQYFGKARVSANNMNHMQIGKCYFISNDYGDLTAECEIELTKMVLNEHAIFQYTYRLIDSGKIVTDYPLMPWNSMSLIIGFEKVKEGTRVTSVIYANNIRNMWGILMTKLLSVINSFQQARNNRKIMEYINRNELPRYHPADYS